MIPKYLCTSPSRSHIILFAFHVPQVRAISGAPAAVRKSQGLLSRRVIARRQRDCCAHNVQNFNVNSLIKLSRCSGGKTHNKTHALCCGDCDRARRPIRSMSTKRSLSAWNSSQVSRETRYTVWIISAVSAAASGKSNLASERVSAQIIYTYARAVFLCPNAWESPCPVLMRAAVLVRARGSLVLLCACLLHVFIFNWSRPCYFYYWHNGCSFVLI